jgi:hypothetical protein
MLRQDIPSLKLWSHGAGQEVYLAIDRRAEEVVNRSGEFSELHDDYQLISIRLRHEHRLWNLARTDPMAEVLVLKPGDLCVSDLDRLHDLEAVLRRLGLQFDSLFFNNSCGQRQLSKEQKRLSDVFQIGMWLMLEATDQMNAMGFPPSDDSAKLNAICERLEGLHNPAIPVHLKQAFFHKLMAYGFENLRDPAPK